MNRWLLASGLVALGVWALGSKRRSTPRAKSVPAHIDVYVSDLLECQVVHGDGSSHTTPCEQIAITQAPPGGTASVFAYNAWSQSEVDTVAFVTQLLRNNGWEYKVVWQIPRGPE